MNNNRDIIITLCSYLCVGTDVKPYTNKEWATISSLLLENNKQPYDLLNFTNDDFVKILKFDFEEIERIKRLFARSASLAFEIEKLNNKGINLITRADKEYPKILKKKLSYKCPPIFYYAGNLEILNQKFIGFVGSRTISDSDIMFTESAVKHFIEEGYSIVSGGAKGVDSVSTKCAIDNGSYAVEFLADSLIKKIKDVNVVNAIQNNKLLLLSATIPSTGFDVGTAMQRNKFIYCLSEKTIVVKSDYNKGGTWAGAKEAINNAFTNVCCWNNNEYTGNQHLIELGADIIDNDFKIEVNNNKVEKIKKEKKVKKEKIEQLNIFDFC